jgi:hypothetical protein
MLIDAKNERVAKWYASYGALPLLDAPLSLLLPLSTVEAALKAKPSVNQVKLKPRLLPPVHQHTIRSLAPVRAVVANGSQPASARRALAAEI